MSFDQFMDARRILAGFDARVVPQCLFDTNRSGLLVTLPYRFNRKDKLSRNMLRNYRVHVARFVSLL